MKCHNCEKNAIYVIGPEERGFPLCLDCYIKWQNINLQELEANQREINFLTAKMESIAGVPGLHPRYPEHPRIIHTGGVTLNNIHVSNSEIGVLNTGTIENVDSTLTVLKTGGNTELVSAVTALSEAVIKSTEITIESKNQILELLGALSSEAVAPKEKRKLAVARAVLSELSAILTGVTTITELWEKAKSIFDGLFGS